MDLMDFGTVQEGKMRLVQEMVPGKQVTLAHIIASPDEIIYQKLGLNPNVDYQQAAIGILSMTPSEISVIAGDIATKTWGLLTASAEPSFLPDAFQTYRPRCPVS
jgi:ethanolamine utilization protein EutS